MLRHVRVLVAVCLVLGAATACKSDPVVDGQPLSRWVTQLKLGVASERLAAVQAIARLGSRVNAVRIPPLIEALRDPDEHVVKEATSALATSGEAAAQSLVGALDDVQIRDEAIAALGAIGPAAKPAVGPLLGILKESPRQASLKEIEEDPYKAFLSGRDDRQKAADALVRIDPTNAEMPAVLCGLLGQGWPTRILASLGDTAIPALAQSLKHDDAEVRARAILALADHHSTKAMAALRGALENGDTRVRGRAGVALADAGQSDVPVVMAIADGLDADEVDECTRAVKTLGRLGSAASPAIAALEKVRARAELKSRQTVGSGRAAARLFAAQGINLGAVASWDPYPFLIHEIDLALKEIRRAGRQ